MALQVHLDAEVLYISVLFVHICTVCLLCVLASVVVDSEL